MQTISHSSAFQFDPSALRVTAEHQIETEFRDLPDDDGIVSGHQLRLTRIGPVERRPDTGLSDHLIVDPADSKRPRGGFDTLTILLRLQPRD
jgi:hypothetical protein